MLDLQQNIRKNMQKRFDLCYNGLEQYNFVLEQGLARRNWQKVRVSCSRCRMPSVSRCRNACILQNCSWVMRQHLLDRWIHTRCWRAATMVTAANGTILNADDLQPEKTIYVRSASRRAKCRVEAVEEINENTQKF